MDPLLDRLRLTNGHGSVVDDPKREFRDVVCVGFLFGAGPWSSSPAPRTADAVGKGSTRRPAMYDLVHEFTRMHPHRWKCVYVGLDEKEVDFRGATEGKLWLALEWNDGSHDDESLKPKEDFLQPGESDPIIPPDRPIPPGATAAPPLDASLPPASKAYSRAALADLRDVFAVPTLHVYHVPSRTWISSGALGVPVKMLEATKRDETWKKWEEGQEVRTGYSDALFELRWPIAIAIVGAIYVFLIRLDDSYSPLRLGEWLESATAAHPEL